MLEEYQPHNIEKETQEYWEKHQSFKVVEDLSKEKFYCLSMLPYPSGHLHMGHVRNYTIGDVIARYQRMLGKNVLQPMGWDAFGLPAENAALKHKLAPSTWTRKNIDHMREQFKSLGFGYDWHREVATCDPEYYRWEQWLFTRLFKRGLAYRKNSIVNWDPVDQTVLANEQVVDGRGWRSGAIIEQRQIPQWFLKITDYADELLQDLDKLVGWPEQVRTMQHHWIGRSEGVNIQFDVVDHANRIEVFTTRPDTLLGATYLAIAPQHALALEVAKNNTDIEAFINECKNTKVAEAELATLEKKGIATNLYAINPLTGDKLPIWIANFVLSEYGSGAVMSVPGHDQRDFEFAQAYGLPIKEVIQPEDGSEWDYKKAAFTDKGKLINSGKFDGLTSQEAFDHIANELEDKQHGSRQTNYRLRDWGVSRQRYWGTPVPIIHCPECGPVPVPEDQLPVTLPEGITLDEPNSPLTTMPEFYETTCPSCGSEAKRDTDTFDTFVESSWYYARYASFNQHTAMLDDRAKYWTPVDQYVGGIEHAVMHLLYARFFHKVLRDEGLLNSDEPFLRLLTQGMVLKDGAKMSKSKGNTVDPKALIDEYGADTVRLFSIFASPPEQSLEWSDSGVAGAHRFLTKLYQFALSNDYLMHLNQKTKLLSQVVWENAPENLRNTRREIFLILNQAQYDFDRLQFNTVVSSAMKIFNLLEKIKPESQDGYDALLIQESTSILLRILAPIAPHITHYLWQALGFGEAIIEAPWPKVDTDALKTENLQIIIQVNGKMRGKIDVPSGASKDEVEAIAVADQNIEKHISGKPLKKVIYVPEKLLNIVV